MPEPLDVEAMKERARKTKLDARTVFNPRPAADAAMSDAANRLMHIAPVLASDVFTLVAALTEAQQREAGLRERGVTLQELAWAASVYMPPHVRHEFRQRLAALSDKPVSDE